MKWHHKKCECKKNNNFFRLSELKTGSTGKVIAICKDRFHRSRIVSIGIQTGANIQIVQNSFSDNGCMIVKVYESQIVLYRKLAEKITIEIDNH